MDEIATCGPYVVSGITWKREGNEIICEGRHALIDHAVRDPLAETPGGSVKSAIRPELFDPKSLSFFRQPTLPVIGG
jgi:hypothetical protein